MAGETALLWHSMTHVCVVAKGKHGDDLGWVTRETENQAKEWSVFVEVVLSHCNCE